MLTRLDPQHPFIEHLLTLWYKVLPYSYGKPHENKCIQAYSNSLIGPHGRMGTSIRMLLLLTLFLYLTVSHIPLIDNFGC